MPRIPEFLSGPLNTLEERTRSPQRDYIGSILAKATGVDAYQRWQQYIESRPNNNLENDMKIHRKPIGLFMGALQVALPFYVDAASRTVAASNRDGTFPVKSFIQAVPCVITDALYWENLLLPIVLNHPIETVAFKAAINIGAPLLGDLFYAVTDRIGRLRPPSTASLAV